MSAPVLVCTVGGSPQPIISAIRAGKPAYVVFIATQDCARPDGGAQPGSIRSLEGAEGIPARTGIGGDWESVIVPPDQPDVASAKITDALRALAGRFPASPLIADYTGGTKSMSAALLAAALGVRGARLQVMAGRRPDLVRVADGTERPFAIVPDFLLIERQAGLLRDAWRSFGYAEAAQGFAELQRQLAARADAPPGLVVRIAELRLLSEAFAAWDRFDHKAAMDLLGGLSDRHGDWRAQWVRALDLILDARVGKGARLLDLWRNAERRAERGQYDDAVARSYRLIEATAQFLLETYCGHDTGELDLGAIPEEARRKAKLADDGTGKAQANLSQAWALVDCLLRERPAARFMRRRVQGAHHNQRESRVRLLKIRNFSILAHGWDPIGRERWDEFADWMRAHFIPEALVPEVEALDADATVPQLPGEPPADL